MASKTAQTTPQNAMTDDANDIGADGIPNVDYPETAEQRAARGKRIAEFDGQESREVERAQPRMFTDTQLASLTTFAEAADALNSVTTVESFSDYGNGFSVLDSKDKKRLVGTPFLIIEWRNNRGDLGEFVSFTCVTKHDERFIVNDGSTGIRDQLKLVEAQRTEKGHPTPRGGLLVPGGLRESTYDSPTGQGKATTYYLSTDKS